MQPLYNPNTWEAHHITRVYRRYSDYPITSAPFSRFQQDWPGHYIHLRVHSFFCKPMYHWQRLKKHTRNETSDEISIFSCSCSICLAVHCQWDHEKCLLVRYLCLSWRVLERPQLLNTSSPSSTAFCANGSNSNIFSSSSSALRLFLKPREGFRKATGIAAARTPEENESKLNSENEKSDQKSKIHIKWLEKIHGEN